MSILKQCDAVLGIVILLAAFSGCGDAPEQQPQDPAGQANANSSILGSSADGAISDASASAPSHSAGAKSSVEWKMVSFPDMGITVEIPTAEGNVIQGTTFERNTDQLDYRIQVSSLSDQAVESLNSSEIGSFRLLFDTTYRLKNAQAGVLRAGKLALIDSRLRLVQGHPAIEFAADDPKAHAIVEMLGILIEKQRSALIWVRTPKTAPNKDGARRIFDSVRFQPANETAEASDENAVTVDALLNEFNSNPLATYNKYKNVPLKVTGFVLSHRLSLEDRWDFREVLITYEDRVDDIVRHRNNPRDPIGPDGLDKRRYSDVACIMRADDAWSLAATGAKVEVRGYLTEPVFNFLTVAMSDCEFVAIENEIEPVVTSKEIAEGFLNAPDELKSERGGHYFVVEGRAVEYDWKIPELSTHIFLEGTNDQILHCDVTGKTMKNPPKPGDLVRLSGDLQVLGSSLMHMGSCRVISITPPKE